MSEMVERVARHLSGWLHGTPTWESCVPMARAAIAAMREPTEAMKKAASNYRIEEAATGRDVESSDVWQAMIDAT